MYWQCYLCEVVDIIISSYVNESESRHRTMRQPYLGEEEAVVDESVLQSCMVAQIVMAGQWLQNGRKRRQELCSLRIM